MTGTALVVDDAVAVRIFVRRALEAEGWTVREATSLAQARVAVDEAKPDVIVLDHLLPDGEGLDQLRAWRRGRVQIPVIAFTSQGGEALAADFMTAGAQDYVNKDGLSVTRIVASVVHWGPTDLPDETSARVGQMVRQSPSSSQRQGGPVDVKPAAAERLRVLIVDDDETIHAALRAMIADAASQITCVPSLEQARQQLQSQQAWDVIILDNELPDGLGLDALRQWRAEGIMTPVVTITGADELARIFMRAGAADFLDKKTLTPLRVRTTLRNVTWLRRLASTTRSDSVRRALR